MPTGNNPRHILLMVGWNYALYTLDSSVLLNGGLTRPCTCIVPEGTVLNPVFPAAVGMRSMTCARLQGVIMGAFQRAVPDRLPAGPASGGPMMNVNTTDSRTGRRVMAAIDPITGGTGGSPFGDGMDGSGANNGFLKNTPVEINEAEVPIRILRYGLEPDSGGAGLHRGGLATVLEFRVQAPGTVVTARNRDRTRFCSWGVQGGGPGAASGLGRATAIGLATEGARLVLFDRNADGLAATAASCPGAVSVVGDVTTSSDHARVLDAGCGATRSAGAAGTWCRSSIPASTCPTR